MTLLNIVFVTMESPFIVIFYRESLVLSSSRNITYRSQTGESRNNRATEFIARHYTEPQPSRI